MQGNFKLIENEISLYLFTFFVDFNEACEIGCIDPEETGGFVFNKKRGTAYKVRTWIKLIRYQLLSCCSYLTIYLHFLNSLTNKVPMDSFAPTC